MRKNIASIGGTYGALAHLAEAFVFYSLTMYSSEGLKPNITSYAENIQNELPLQFVQSIGTLSSVIEMSFLTLMVRRCLAPYLMI